MLTLQRLRKIKTMKRIFIWVAHPAKESLNQALADHYQAGAEGAGHEVTRMDLADMKFGTEGFEGYRPNYPTLEPDLLTWQEHIKNADHIAVFHPYWWASMPGRARIVLERALSPGFGFQYHTHDAWWDKLLTGRTGDAIITSDTPPLMDRFLYGRPGRRVIKNQIFDFCGIKPRKILQLGPPKGAKPQTLEKWFKQMEKLGASVK